MAMVIKSELTSGTSSIVALLAQDVADTANLISKLTAFSNASELKGADYDAAKKKALAYVEVLNKRKQIASALSSAISQSTSSFASFMEEFDMLDDSEIGDLELKLSQAKESYQSLQGQLDAALNGQEDYDASSIQAQMSSLQELIQKVERKLDKLRRLASTDASLYGAISQCQGQISTYSSGIGAITVANIASTNVNV